VHLDPYMIIKAPLITEQVTGMTEDSNTYGFRVDMRANKVQIRQAVEKIWGVDVVAVRTMIRKGKPRRMKHNWSQQPAWKRALVRLADGQRIES
jgi:large subunit ribosomal protein L23